MKLRFILRAKQTEDEEVNRKDLLRYFKEHNIDVVDDSMFPKMILVETGNTSLNAFTTQLKKQWSVIPETSYEVPNTRKFIKTKK